MDIKTIISSLTPYKKIIFITLACLIALFALWFALDWFSGYLERQSVEDNKKAINVLQEGANDIKANLSNLKVNEAVAGTETNVARNAYNNASAQTDEARSKTNQSLENLKTMQNANFRNSNAQKAQEAACALYPELCQP